MKNYKPIFLLGAAVIVAFLTSLLTYDWLKKKAGVKGDAAPETQQVAVAAGDLAWGTVLQKEMIKTVTYLKDNLPEGSHSDADALKDRVLIYPVKMNEPIFESRLAPKSVDTGGVAAVIGKEKRAMAVKVDKVIGVSGFVHPGNRVDVLVTLKRVGKTNSSFTKTVLENIKVLAAGTEIEKKGKHGKPEEVDVITLEVNPLEAEKLALAATEGKIQLALRSFTDTEDFLTKGATPETLIASYSPASPPNKAERKFTAKGTTNYTVELVKGDKTSKMKFEGGSK